VARETATAMATHESGYSGSAMLETATQVYSNDWAKIERCRKCR